MTPAEQLAKWDRQGGDSWEVSCFECDLRMTTRTKPDPETFVCPGCGARAREWGGLSWVRANDKPAREGER